MVGKRLVIALVLELAGIDARLARRKLDKKYIPIMMAASALWPLWCPPPALRHSIIIQYVTQQFHVVKSGK
jgi:hypothetical protein